MTQIGWERPRTNYKFYVAINFSFTSMQPKQIGKGINANVKCASVIAGLNVSIFVIPTHFREKKQLPKSQKNTL